MAMERFQFDRSGQDPRIEVIVGNAQLGAFRINLKSPGHPARVVVRYDPVANPVPPGPTVIGRIGEIDDSLMGWDIAVLPTGAAPAGQRFSLQVRITQVTPGAISQRERVVVYGGAIAGLTNVAAIVELDVL